MKHNLYIHQNLFSDKYINCTGTVGIGRDKLSGKEIAFISHQDPDYFLNKGAEETEKFSNDLKATLNKLIAKSEDGTVEVALFGGNYDPADSTSKKSVDYKKSIEMLSAIVQECLGHTPVVLNEANHDKGAIDVTVVTQERKIFIGE